MSFRHNSNQRWLAFALFAFAATVLSPQMGYAQNAECQTSDGWQSPTAAPGGPYVASTGQNITFNGWDSWSWDGPIIYYFWDFGDGSYGTGPNPNHQYTSEGAYTVTLTVCDDGWNCASSLSYVTAGLVNLPARINFDELPNNMIVADQYFSQYGVRFYSANAFYPIHTSQNCGPCSTTSALNFITTKPDDGGVVNVEFFQPVNNLSFYMIGVDVFFDQFAVIDVYRGGSFYASYPVYGNGTRTVGFTFGSLDNISKIVIRNITDVLGIGFDDFTFNVPSDIKITSGRVGGYLNGTTQNALLGADIALQATPLPGGFAGGSYSWTCTPTQLCSILNGSNSSSVNLRTVDTGTVTATVSYTKNGLTATGSLTINSILPSVDIFQGEQTSNTIAIPGGCGDGNGWWWYRLGCGQSQLQGIDFVARAVVPTVLSDPAQSGVKYVQAVSVLRKKTSRGLRCITKRTSETNIASGWQLDSGDPYPPAPPRYFSDGNTLVLHTADSPGSALTQDFNYQFVDSVYVDDQFEMYIVYFTTNSIPIPQRPIAKLPWNWGGLVVFDANGHHIRPGNVPPISREGEPTTSMVTMHGNITEIQNVESQCPGGPPLTDNKIDSSRFFVRQHYLDFLGREPDASGWDHWTADISQCVFDQSCIRAYRINTGLAFMFCDEFINSTGDPVMANKPGTPGFNASVYNGRFVYWCYMKYLRRDPFQTNDYAGWQHWTDDLNSNGDYAHIIDAFQVCDEYRNRQGFH